MTREQLREFEKDLIKIGLENVQNIVLIKNGATNSDVIKAIFGYKRISRFYDYPPLVDVYGLDNNDDNDFVTLYADWWNALYKKGGKECR